MGRALAGEGTTGTSLLKESCCRDSIPFTGGLVEFWAYNSGRNNAGTARLWCCGRRLADLDFATDRDGVEDLRHIRL